MQYTTRIYAKSWGDEDGLRQMLLSKASSFRMTDARHRYLAVHCAQLDLPLASVVRVGSSGHMIDLVDDEVITVMLPLRGMVRVRAGEHRFQTGADGSLTFLPSARQTFVDAAADGRFEALMLKMPYGARDADTEGGRVILPHGGSPLVHSSISATLSLRQLLDYVTTDLASRSPLLKKPHVARSMQALILEQFHALFAQAPGGSAVLGVSAAKVRAAEEFMHAHHTLPLTVADIAKACGVGVRSLQVSFRSVVGVSPRTRLSEIRLDDAHRLLLAGTQKSVTDIALECGIAHLGRFATSYRHRFGELPSETLKRGRGDRLG